VDILMYENPNPIESCKRWFDSDFFGQVKGNIILQVAGETLKAKKLKSSAKLNRSLIVNGKKIKYCSYLANDKMQSFQVK